MITQAVQDYLKIIFKLANNGKAVSTNAIAEKLQISQASVTGMIKKLSDLKLTTHRPYYGVELTQTGRKIALEIIRHHRLLELYLAEALGYSWDQVHDEAEKLEHVISEEFEDKMAKILGNPKADPHGAPIPSKDGLIEERTLECLSVIDAGQKVQVKEVSDKDPEMLRYLGDIGIFPDVMIDVMEKAPFGGPLLIKVAGKEYNLGERLTDNILVSQTPCNH